VFSIDGSRPVRNFIRVKDRLDAKLKLAEPFVLHDLRRSCASGMQRLGVRAEVVEACLNHRSGVYRGVSGVYQRDPMLDAKRVAFETWGDHVERLVGGKPAKVIKLRRT
jgi:integrase